MTDKTTDSSPIERLASLFKSHKTGLASYKDEIKRLSDPVFSAGKFVNIFTPKNPQLKIYLPDRSWWYQKCTEFGYFKTTNAPEQPFGSLIPLEYFYQKCMDIFGSTFNRTFIERAIEATNGNYGGWNVSLSKVLFLNGQLDPWHDLGVTESLGPSVQAILLPEATHCADYSLPYSEVIEAAQAKIAAIIGQFLA